MSDFNSYRIVNPDAGTFFVTTASPVVAIAASNQPKVDGSTMVYGDGTEPTSDNRTNINVVALGSTETELYGAQVIRGSASGNGVSAELPKSAGNFATMTPGQYIMRRAASSDGVFRIAGVEDNTLRSGASDYGIRRSINARTVVRGPLTATAVRNNQWSVFSGAWITDPTASTDGLGDVSGLTTGGVDHAVTPTGLIPGELVYIAGNSATILVPKQDDYKVRTTSQAIG